jgi:hypothetical protein
MVVINLKTGECGVDKKHHCMITQIFNEVSNEVIARGAKA